LEDVHDENGETNQEATAKYKPDPARYKGVFGTAVLSKYPIKKVELFQLRNQAYDWYWGEKPKVSFLEKTRRLGTELVFKNKLTRELKVGGRVYFRVDLEVPELPKKTLTIINVHLEIKCQPKGRELQMHEILSYIRDIDHPVVMMGDFNAAPTDISPTTVTRVVTRTAKNPYTWFHIAVQYMTPYGLVNTFRGASNSLRTFQNPLAKHIPVVGENPVRPMFQSIFDFRFSDGGAFDFRGNKNRSINGKGNILANSNQRDLKGFKTSFQVKRPLGPWFGKLRLDWAFVKSFLTDSEDDYATYKFAPHFGETLEEMNANLRSQISDHHPNVIDLPFQEPNISN
jgi:hypothetical protein